MAGTSLAMTMWIGRSVSPGSLDAILGERFEIAALPIVNPIVGLDRLSVFQAMNKRGSSVNGVTCTTLIKPASATQ